MHFRGKRRLTERGANLALPTAHVKLPAVPGASDDTAAQLPLPQRTTLVRADSIERIDVSGDVEQRHDAVSRHAFQVPTQRQFVQLSDFNPLGHEKSYSSRAKNACLRPAKLVESRNHAGSNRSRNETTPRDYSAEICRGGDRELLDEPPADREPRSVAGEKPDARFPP